MRDTTRYTVPKEPGRWRAITLAVLVHAALLAFLWIGVQWQSDTPVTIEAEVWSPQAREAAPPPEPMKAPEPQPIIKAPPPAEPSIEKALPNPAIVLEQEKKRKELEKKRAEEQRLAELKEKRRFEEERFARLKQQADEKKLEKEKADKALAKKADDDKKRKQDEADAKLAAKMREEDMRRITGSGGNGDAAKSQGGRVDGAYAQRVGAKIRSNIIFTAPEGLEGNPAVEFEVQLLPDGSIASMHKRKSSGISAFDEAVARAIEKSQPYPKDKNGSVPSSFIGVHKPKDQ